jgi:hypothetical protein
MRAWFTKNLGDAMLAGAALEHVAALFQATCGMPAFPADAAVFVRHESEGRLHCEVHLYFSPAAVALAQALGAVPCARPSLHGLV